MPLPLFTLHLLKSLLSPLQLQLVSPNATILDIDTLTASSLTLTIQTITNGDEFIFPDPPSTISMQSRMIAATREIMYSGRESLSVYINLLTQLQFMNNVDEPQPGTRRVTVQVFTPSDNGTSLGSNIAEVMIQVSPTNDNTPVFNQSSYRGFVFENEPSGTLTGVTVYANDTDIYGSTVITYHIDGNNLDFAVDPSSGVITTLRPLDADVPGYLHQITVVANDNDGTVSRSASVRVTIEVLDQNDIPPVFDQALYNFAVLEDVPIGSTISGVVVARDSDRTAANSVVTYQIQEPDGSGVLPASAVGPLSALLPFTIDSTSGAIVTTDQLDFETTLEYSFTVLATDSGLPTLTGTTEVRVTIQDINDNTPAFDPQSYTIQLLENAPIGATVLTVTATDADSTTNGQIRYSLQGTNTFSINATTGDITLMQTLDHERVQAFNFTVIATDLADNLPRSSDAQVFVFITNVNDNSPFFTPPSLNFTVIENTVLQVQVTASDSDGDSLSFRLNSSDVTGIFEINQTTGELRSVSGFRFDFELRQTFSLVVEVSDGIFAAYTSVTINVLDANDLPPVFERQRYDVTISEAVSVGHSVVQVVATDGDTGTNADIEYSILGGNTGNVFSIDPQSGEITVAGSLDFDFPPLSYILTVLARNSAPPYLNTTVIVVVNLTDANDLQPMLTLDPLNITYIENSGQHPIAANIRVTDQDSGTHPVTQCSVSLLRGECSLSESELTQACGSSTTCTEQCAESIAVDQTLVRGLRLSNGETNNTQTISIFGNVTELTYQQLLSTLTYTNMAHEPVPGTRTVEILCQDGSQLSNTLQLLITVELRNEFCVAIATSQNAFSFTEEMGDLPVGQMAAFVLSDGDRTPHDSVSQINVTLSNRLNGPFESISVTPVAGVTVESSSGDAPVISGPQTGGSMNSDSLTLQITGPASIGTFTQVLQSLVYTNTHSEPSLGERRIVVTPVDGTLSCHSVNLTITVVPTNDNAPDLLLNVTNFVRYEEESGAVLFAVEAGLRIEDPDHNDVFGLEGANVTLEGVRNVGSEMVGYNGSLLPGSVSGFSESGGE